jgi:hypothetical protein
MIPPSSDEPQTQREETFQPRSSRLQRRGSVCAWEDEALKAPNIYEFEEDLYTNAFLSVLSSSGPETQKRHGPVLHFCGFLFTPCLCLGFVVFIQVFALVGVADFVSTSWGLSLGGYDYALRDYAETNHSMQIANSEPLCGVFEQLEYEKEIPMSDGSTYMASDDHPISMAYKMPGGSWDSKNIVDDKSMLDESLLAVGDDFRTKTPKMIESQDSLRMMIERGGLHYWMSGSVYFLYHYSMSMLLAFVLIVEVRKIYRFSLMLRHFYGNDMIVPSGEPCFVHDKIIGKLEISALTRQAFAAGIGVIVLRIYVVVCLCAASFWLFLLSMSRMELIFNALALGFILEIDDLVYLALSSIFTKKMLGDLKEIELELKEIELPGELQKNAVPMHNIWIPIGWFCTACLYSISCRLGQIYMRKCYFAAIASVCLFLGPTPEVTSYPVVAPVPGFCESLLDAACAANVTGPASVNGPCYIADAPYVSKQVSSMNEPFEDMFDASGERRSWIEWGAPKEELLAIGWDSLPHSQRNVMRKICLQMYQPAATVDTRVVDDDTEEVMNGGPFFCPTEYIYPIIVPNPGNVTNIWDLSKEEIVMAVDKCRLSPDHPALAEYASRKMQTGKGNGARKTKKQTDKLAASSAQQTKLLLGRSKTMQMINHPRKRRPGHHHTLSARRAAFLDRL